MPIGRHKTCARFLRAGRESLPSYGLKLMVDEEYAATPLVPIGRRPDGRMSRDRVQAPMHEIHWANRPDVRRRDKMPRTAASVAAAWCGERFCTGALAHFVQVRRSALPR